MRFSVILILVLLGWLCSSWLKTGKPVVEPSQSVISSPVQPVVPSVSGLMIRPELAPVRSQPFHWTQLYGRDYHTYVGNLRAIGCPEPTLRAIVAADVHRVILRRGEELEKELSSLATNTWPGQLANWSANKAVEAEIARLPEDEAAMLADYLGERPVTGSTISVRAAASRKTKEFEPIVAPLIARPVDVSTLNLDGSQLEAIKELQKNFLQEIGGPSQDPNDPDYQARWRAAQVETDDLMRGMLGDQAYQEYQIRALAQAQTGASGQAQEANPSSPSPAQGNN